MRRIAVVCLAVLAAFAVFAAVRQDAISETKPGSYSEVVDNSDSGRFVAPENWKKSGSGKGINGDDYRVARPSKGGSTAAVFKAAIPEDGEYAVYVRWPEVRGLNGSVPVGVETAYGTKWTKVDQRKGGGSWVRVGEFEMRKDEAFPIRISNRAKGRGNVAADAVKVEEVSSYEEPAATAPTTGAAPDGTMRTASAVTGYDVARRAMYLADTFRNQGVRYQYGACTSTLMSCTCFTRRVFSAYGYALPMDQTLQVRYGTAVSGSALRPGDLVYFKENGLSGPVTHVGVYVGVNTATGQRMISHSSSYFGTTVTSEMRWIYGYAGARRLV